MTETHAEYVQRITTLNKITEDKKFVPSKEELDEHHKAANSFWATVGAKQESTGAPHCEQYRCKPKDCPCNL